MEIREKKYRITQAYVLHSHRRTCPIHTCVHAPFTQADVPHSHFGAHCPIYTGCPSSSDPVPLDSWMLIGKFPKWASESPSPAPAPTAVHLPPHLAFERPAPPFTPLVLLPHPSLRAHLYSPSTVVFIFLSKVSARSFVYVLLPLSCTANHHSLVVLRVVSRAYQTCIQRSCRAALLEECPQHHGHKGDPGVTSGTCGTIGERAQVILV